VEDSISENFEAVTSNSNVDLMGVNGDKINVSNKNGRINFGYIIGKDINIDAVNSVIEIRQIKTTNINASTRNGCYRRSQIFLDRCLCFRLCQVRRVFMPL